MHTILITGATGNIGSSVIRYLFSLPTSHRVIAGVRNEQSAKGSFIDLSSLVYRHFDFEDPATFHDALEGVDVVFLVRPPHLADVETTFRPFIDAMRSHAVRGVVFLSVQGAERSSVIPHNKIERLLRGSGIPFVFLRPSYFMQNLTTTLLDDIRQRREIVLPAGRAVFNWVDVENIGEVGARVLEHFEDHQQQAFDITGEENEDFHTVTTQINRTVSHPIRYTSINPVLFFVKQYRKGLPPDKILVLLMLHFLPRFQQDPVISDSIRRLTGRPPTRLKEFIEREKHLFEPRE